MKKTRLHARVTKRFLPGQNPNKPCNPNNSNNPNNLRNPNNHHYNPNNPNNLNNPITPITPIIPRVSTRSVASFFRSSAHLAPFFKEKRCKIGYC